MARKKRNWLEIEHLKDGSPNILTSFRRIKEMNLKRRKDEESGKKTRRQYACVFCGRVYSNGYRLMGHLAHCDKRKQFKTMLETGIEYTVGNKTFRVISRKVKILRNAEMYEKSFGEKVKQGAMTPEEAERLFFAFLQGAESGCSRGTVQYKIKPLLGTSTAGTDTKTKKSDKTTENGDITRERDINARDTHTIKEEKEKEEETPPIPPLPPPNPLYPPIIPPKEEENRK